MAKEILAVADDCGEITGGRGAFLAGLVVGRTQGKVDLKKAIDISVNIDSTNDQQLKLEL